jgi:hypothetical protein
MISNIRYIDTHNVHDLNSVKGCVHLLK